MEEVVETSQMPEELKGLAGVDGISVSDGLLYCGSAGDFVNFLESFYQDIDIQADEIEDAFIIGLHGSGFHSCFRSGCRKPLGGLGVQQPDPGAACGPTHLHESQPARPTLHHRCGEVYQAV